MFFKKAKDELLAGKKIRRRGGEIWQYDSKTSQISINGVINTDFSKVDIIKLCVDVSASDWELVDEK